MPQPKNDDQRAVTPHSYGQKTRPATLAIVIPAWKRQYLDETLKSIAAQSRKTFTAYVGDDCSPYDLESVCRKWASSIDIKYHRFPSNVGQRNLPLHWERCIDLCDEEWIWVFGDDDTMDEDCVERFFQEVEQASQPCNLYHFNTRVIDHHGEVVSSSPDLPSHLEAMDYLWMQMTGAISTYLPDFIFRKEKYTQHGRFQHFPRGWFSDIALWVTLARESGIRTLSGPRVNWRLSGLNISSNHTTDRHLKLDASIRFLCWVQRHLEHHYGRRVRQRFNALRLRWLLRQSTSLGVSPFLLLEMTGSNLRLLFADFCKTRYYFSLLRLQLLNTVTTPVKKRAVYIARSLQDRNRS